MIDTANAKPLKIDNENNKLDQDNFIVIHFAPARAHFDKNGVWQRGVIESDFDRVYVIDHNGKQLFVKLKDFRRLNFEDIKSSFTVECSGESVHFWKYNFMKKYPFVTAKTEMAIYEYERVKK